MHIIITGYYKKDNLGDDLFESIAEKICESYKFKKQITSYKILPIEKINLVENRSPLDRVILFGGETLNNFFIDKLLELWKYNNDIKFNAIGVSCNQKYEDILNKLHIFESISFRSKKDYLFFKDYIKSYYHPDIVFTQNKISSIFNLKKNYIGFFLSQTAVCNSNKNDVSEYISKIVEFIRFLISKRYKIYLFPMCTNEKYLEDDNIINVKILEKFSEHDKSYVKVYTTNKKIFKKIHKLKYSICFRYHAHILSIINNIPFISISNTPKVVDLLNENNLVDLHCNLNNIKNTFENLEKNNKIIRKKLNNIYNNYHNDAIVYKNPELYFENKNENTYYLEIVNYSKIYDYILNRYNEFKSDDKYFNTQIITFYFTKNLDNDYNFGLREKINRGLENLRGDIYWLINDSILKKNLYFYESVANTLNIKLHKSGKINIRYINQNDYKGLHRAGWQYVVDNLMSLHSTNSMLCDLYLDRTFHWNYIEYKKLGIIPYKKDWIGFIHHTTDTEYTSYNTLNLFKNKLFLTSLLFCKALIVLSDDLKNKIEKIMYKNNINIKIFKLTHPTEFVDDKNMFTIKKFNTNENKKIIQIGAWMRNIDAINKLRLGDNKLKLEKYALCGKKMENYYFDDQDTNDLSEIDDFEIVSMALTNCISRDNQKRNTKLENSVKLLTFMENEEYDNLLSENIVFINLVGASAVNTVIECIVRNTPIIINKLPALIEVLGDKYPLFYENIFDVKNLLTIKNIETGYNYLKNLDKTKFKIETFMTDFNNILDNI